MLYTFLPFHLKYPGGQSGGHQVPQQPGHLAQTGPGYHCKQGQEEGGLPVCYHHQVQGVPRAVL